MGIDRRWRQGLAALGLATGLAAGLALPLAGVAQAADPVAADPAAVDDLSADDLLAKAPQIEESRFWYLRVDAGYVFNETPDGVGGGGLDDAALVGLGIGGRFSDWLRLDLTADYRIRADYALGGVSGDYGVATLLANAYVDLGSWNALTPYIGAGIGLGYADLDAPGYGSGWGLAWAAMGGVAIDLAPNWQLDLGYRYLALENIDLGGGLPDIDQAAHEIRIGLRVAID